MAIKKERVNIGRIARELQAQGASGDDSYTSFAAMKPEFYALQAVIIDKAVRDAYEARDLDSLVDGLDPRYPFLNLGTKMIEPVFDATIELDSRLRNSEETPQLQSVAARLHELFRTQSQEQFDNRSFAPSIPISLMGGIQTAVNVMSGALEVIGIIGKGKSPEELVGIAERSYPLIARWASIHLAEFLPTVHALQVRDKQNNVLGPFKPQNFTFSGEQGAERLDVSDRGRESVLRSLSTQEPVEYDSPTVGCPAMVNFGQGSAVRTLWDWHLEIAQRVYPRLAERRAA